VFVAFNVIHRLKKHPSGQILGILNATRPKEYVVVDTVNIAFVEFAKRGWIVFCSINQGDFFLLVFQQIALGMSILINNKYLEKSHF